MAKDVEQLIERQAKMWEMSRRLAEHGGEQARQALAHLDEGPWLTVSRQLGSRGAEVAARLSDSLGWQVFDREIVAAIARETHTKEKIISRLDEHAVGHLNDLLRNLVVPDDLGQAGFLQEMTRVVWALGRQGKAILLGRGANWILNSRFGLRVRLVAPFDQRVAWIAAHEGRTPVEAEKKIRAHDAEQRAFIRQAFGKEIDDAQGYDLTLNMGGVDPEGACATIETLLRAKLAD